MSPARPDVRMVAVDMDGTFLREDRTYDRPRFARLRARMDAAGVRFVVASGTHLTRLRAAFDRPDELAFVADNGANITDRGEVVFTAELPDDDARHVIDLLERQPGLLYLASGPEHAYAPASVPEEFAAHMRAYFPTLRRVGSLQDVRGELNKFALIALAGHEPDPALLAGLEGRMTAVASGAQSTDLIIPGVHKASGLQRLMDRWGIVRDQVAAFGDSPNDLEMLRFAGYSFAVANATDEVKAAATAVIPANDDDGVLDQLERWFGSDR